MTKKDDIMVQCNKCGKMFKLKGQDKMDWFACKSTNQAYFGLCGKCYSRSPYV